VNGLPREARDGLMRVWLEILREKHPGTTWVPVQDNSSHQSAIGHLLPTVGAVTAADELATAA
jgi:hypothetical protein